MKNHKSTVLDALLYLVVYMAIQVIVGGIIGAIFGGEVSTTMLLTSFSIVNGLTILTFWLTRWTPISPKYLRKRHWDVLFWTILMPLGLVIPLNLIQESLPFSTETESLKALEKLVTNQWGLLLVGFVAPIAEEMVFRGAILRSLLHLFDSKKEWNEISKKRWRITAVIIAALTFGLVHLNPGQIVNATLMGLLLGYLYVRTGSMLPCIVFHCINNTIVYIIERTIPNIDDMTMLQLAGSKMHLALYIIFSLCIFLPSLIQFHQRTQK